MKKTFYVYLLQLHAELIDILGPQKIYGSLFLEFEARQVREETMAEAMVSASELLGVIL
jgi:hypothetical protein